MARLTADGSSALDADDRTIWHDRFGLWYRHVQWQPTVPSRAERRLMARRQRLRNDGARKTFG